MTYTVARHTTNGNRACEWLSQGESDKVWVGSILSRNETFFFWSVPRYWATPNLSYHCFGATWQVHERGWLGTCIYCFNLLVVFVWNCMVWVVMVIKEYSKSLIAEVLARGRTGKSWENPVSSVVALCSAGMRRKWKFFVVYYCVECRAEWQRRVRVSQPGKYIFRATRCRYPYAEFTRKWVLKTYPLMP
jgi:hypothetical protein